LNRATSEVSNKIKRGKNTTRNVELFCLSDESYIVDTPGFNLQNIELQAKSIACLFPEFNRQFLDNTKVCKFRDCLHMHEPDCGLDKNFERYKYYKELIYESMNHSHQSLEG